MFKKVGSWIVANYIESVRLMNLGNPYLRFSKSTISSYEKTKNKKVA